MKRKSAKPGSERKPAKPPAKAPPPIIPPARRWLFRLLALVLIPLMTLSLLEIGLRLGGYGYSTALLKQVRIADHDMLVNNDEFSLRFFPPELARYFGPIQIPAGKSPDTFRIFVLGESAAMGDPEPAFGAIRYLEVLLRERFPQQKFEVVNVALTAINSHVILPIAREVARHQGDLWIIYMGNNEMVGPFGAATVFGAQAPPVGLVRLSLAVQKTRTGQLLMSLARKLRGRGTAAKSWGGMEMFVGSELPPDAPRKQTVYRNFQRNLADILDVGLNSGAKVVLNTMSVNLKDCPPFASIASANLSASDRAACDKLSADGVTEMGKSNYTTAAQLFEQAAKLDAADANLHYRWGQSLLAETNLTAARAQFQQACDTDALPFRTDSRLNAVIEEEAKARLAKNLVLLDAATLLATNEPSGVCGQETFYEHVHFNFAGNYRLALLWARQVEKALPASASAKSAGPWASQSACDQLLGLSDWNRLFVLQGVVRRLQRPPLSEQAGNAARLAAFNGEIQELVQRLNGAAIPTNRATFEQAVKLAPQDYYLARNHAEFLEAIGDVKAATTEWRRMQELMPLNYMPRFQIGRLLGLQGQTAEAKVSLSQSIALRPSLAEGWYERGNVEVAATNVNAALADYDHALSLRPDDLAFLGQKARALGNLNRHAEAVTEFRRLVELAPTSAEAYFELGNELAAINEKADARAQYEKALQLRPNHMQTHLNLGILLATDGQFDRALGQFDAILRLEPTNAVAREYFDRVQGWKNQKR